MAILDVIIVPKEDAWLRLVSFSKEEKATFYVLDNGSGDNLLVLLTENGVLLKGFDHENELNQFAANKWDETFFEQIFAGLPEEFEELLDKDAKDNTTFCMWCMDDSDIWTENEIDNNDGGKEFLLRYIHKTPQEWSEWAKDYYEVAFHQEVVKKIYNGENLSKEDVIKLNPECNMDEVFDEIMLIKLL